MSAACHSSTDAPGASSAAGPVARFKLAGDAAPAFLDVPFPTSAYLDDAGRVIDPVPGLEAFIPNNGTYITKGLAQNDGFSRVAYASFAVDDPTKAPNDDGAMAAAKIDVATLPVAETECVADGSSVFLIDLAPADPSQARIPCRAGYHDDTPRSSTTPVVAVGPARGILLAEGHDYAVVITSRVKDVAGRALGASADMKAVAAGTASGKFGALYNKAYATVMASVGPALAKDGAQIVSLAPYRTMNKSRELFAMRDALEAAPAATLSWAAADMAPMGAAKFAAPVNGKVPAGFTASLDDLLGVATVKLGDNDDPSSDQAVHAHDAVGAVGSAVFSALNYLRVKPDGYTDIEHRTFAYAAGAPVLADPVKIWVSFAVPKSPMPAGGYPTVIVQHGLSGSRLYLADLANVLAAKGWLVAAIDSVTFGARAEEAKFQVDKINVWAKAPGATYDGPDGIADPVDQGGNPSRAGDTNGSFDMFGGLENLIAVRDQFRQAGFDTAQLVKMLRANPDLSPLDTGAGAPKVDANHIAYLGDSLGAMEGTIAAAIEPRLTAWVLNVNGGSLLTDLAAHSPTIGAQVAEAAAVNFRLYGDRMSETHPFMQLLQDIVEPGDPITYAPFLVKSPQPLAGVASKPRNMLQVQVLYDEIVSNEANEAIARAGGWGYGTPNVGSNADVWDVPSAASNPRKTPLPDVNPDASGAIHDTPFAGTTAVLIQCSPCAHGADIIDRHPGHSFLLPFFDKQGYPAFQRAATGFQITEAFEGIQAATTTFLGDAMAGNVPRVMGFKAPIRDYDNDGAPDDTDPDPSDPAKH